MEASQVQQREGTRSAGRMFAQGWSAQQEKQRTQSCARVWRYWISPWRMKEQGTKAGHSSFILDVPREGKAWRAVERDCSLMARRVKTRVRQLRSQTDPSGPTPFPSLITSCQTGRSQTSFRARSPRCSALRRLGSASVIGGRLGRSWSPPMLPRWGRRHGEGGGRGGAAGEYRK